MTSMSGTIKKAMETHWAGTPYSTGPVEGMAWALYQHFSLSCGKGLMLEELRLEDITEEYIEGFKYTKRIHGTSNSTINKYLSCLSVLFDVAGVPKPNIRRLPEARVEKWWLTPERYRDLMIYMKGTFEVATEFGETHRRKQFRYLVQIMVEAGLRVRETLALKRSDMNLQALSIKVPGTKTAGAEATIPISERVAQAIRWLNAIALANRRQNLFTISYDDARGYWQHCRKWLGVSDIPTATLKALRRTFAANATKAGMPTAVLKEVMRHENIETTMGYLRLTGAGLAEEARKYMTAGIPVRNYQLQGDYTAKDFNDLLAAGDIEDHSGGPSREEVAKWVERFASINQDGTATFNIDRPMRLTMADVEALSKAYSLIVTRSKKGAHHA